LKVKLFGPFQLWRKETLLSHQDWDRRKTRLLLKLLLTRPGKAFTVDQLLDALYPDADPKKVRFNLLGRISQLRRVLEPSLKKGKNSRYILKMGKGTYGFNDQADCWLDTQAFEVSLKQAQGFIKAENWIEVVGCLEQALTLYQGVFLEDEPYEEWALPHREYWSAQHAKALQWLANAQAKQGQFKQALEVYDQWIELFPTCESAYLEKMHCAVQAGNHKQALQTYKACEKALREGLTETPSAELQTLYHSIRNAAPATPKVPNNLPVQTTSFVGRIQELLEISELLSNPHSRLLTLTGLGGIGKTRLAIESGFRQLEHSPFADGVFFVPLAGLNTSEFLLNTVADGLNFSFYGQTPPETQLFNYLQEKRLLLILDNFEHLIDKAILVSNILKAAPRVKVMVTSRERLNLQEEWLFEVKGLSFPASSSSTELENYEAVRLFTERATQIRQSPFLKEDEPVIAQICRLVEGMPLGIELTTAWTRLIDCRQVVVELEKSLDFLASPSRNIQPRHQSIKAVFEHSWKSLSLKEQDVFQKLSVFRGGFTLEAAQCVAEADLLNLNALLDKSMIFQVQSGRYAIHELLRQFAEEKLREKEGRHESIRDKHCKFFVNFLYEKNDTWTTKDQLNSLELVKIEIENIRIAWNFSCKMNKTSETNKALESLNWFYTIKSDHREWLDSVDKVLQYIDKQDNAISKNHDLILLQARLLMVQGYNLLHLGFMIDAKKLIKKSLKLSCEINNKTESFRAVVRLAQIERLLGNYLKAIELQYYCLAFSKKNHSVFTNTCYIELGVLFFHLGQYEKAIQYYKKAMYTNYKRGDLWGLAIIYNNLAEIFRLFGEYDKSLDFNKKSLQTEEKFGNKWGIAISLKNLGQIQISLGNYYEARKLCKESLTIEKELGDLKAISRSLEQLGRIAYRSAHYQKAKNLLQESLEISRSNQDQWTSAKSLIILGLVAIKEDQLLHSKNYLSEAFSICERIKQPVGIANSLYGLGIVALKSRKPQKAKEYFQKALLITQKIQLTPLIFQALLGFCKLCCQENCLDKVICFSSFISQSSRIEKWLLEEAKEIFSVVKRDFTSEELQKLIKTAQSWTIEQAAKEALSI